MLNGAITAMITPMTDDGSVDYKTFEGLIEHQLEGGIRGLVINGTTGESPTVEPDELKKLIKIAVKKVKGHRGGICTIIVGTGTNSTKKTVKNTEIAKDLGADAALVVTPYYNKPNTSGLIGHFEETAKVGLQIIVYDIGGTVDRPGGRTGRPITIPEFKTLAEINGIIGVKAASGSIEQIKQLINEVARPKKNYPYSDFKVWSGDDNLTLDVMREGGDGVISVISNLVPNKVHELTTLMATNLPAAEELANELAPLVKAAFIETNPVPIKYMMYMKGLIKSSAVRLPLGQMSMANREKVDAILAEYNSKNR